METKELAQLLGISHQMANRLKKLGMPTHSLESSIALRKQNLDVTQTKKWRIDGNSGIKCQSENFEAKADADSRNRFNQVNCDSPQLDLKSTDADVLFKNARALKEKAAALLAMAEYDKFMGNLVLRDHVERIIFERARQYRDGLLSCSRRIAPEIAGRTNITEIEGVLNREFRLLLQDFSNLPVIQC